MSSITGADRSRQTDELRNQREEYQNREAEEIKKHKKEMRRMAQKNDQEIEQIKNNYEEQLDSLRKKSSDALSEKDQANMAKIEELRKLYSDSLAKKTVDTQDKREALQEAYNAQMMKQRSINDQQRAILKQNFDDSLAEKNREFKEYGERAQTEMHETISKNAQALGEKHKTEVSAILEDRDARLGQAARDLKESRSISQNQLKDAELQHHLNEDRIENNWKTAYLNKQHEMSELDKRRNEELQFSRVKMEKDFSDAWGKKTQALERAHQDLKDEAIGRIDRDVRAVENKNKQIQNDHIVEMMTTKRLRDLEKKHVVMDYEDRMQKLNDSNQGLIERVKEVNVERIQEANKKNEDVLSQATQRFKTDQMMENERHQQDRNRLEIEHKAQIQNLSSRTDDRVEKVLKSSNETQKIQAKMHGENLNALKGSYQGELLRQREAQMEQLKNTYLRMDERFRTAEQKNQKKLEETVENYENKINQIKEQYENDLKRQSQTYESRIENQKKVNNQEQKTEEIKYQAKYQELQNQHDKEIDRLEKRHQEQMASLAQKLNYYRKS